MVNLSENNKHKNVTGIDNESLAKTTLVSLCPEPLHQENGAITFAHIIQQFRLRTVFICAQKCISFAHSFTVTFAHMFLRLFLGQLLVFYQIKVRQIKYHPLVTGLNVKSFSSRSPALFFRVFMFESPSKNHCII